MIGINGGGKTTTIGKLAHRLKGEGKTVILAAADTQKIVGKICACSGRTMSLNLSLPIRQITSLMFLL